MLLFFAGSEAFVELVKEYDGNMLFSYYHINKSMRQNPLIKNTYNIKTKVFMDSGAFSAFSLGSKIDIDEYISFCKKTDVDYYAVLDVIGDPEGTLKNQNYMESQGVNPVPCFHYGEDFKYLDMYCKKYDFIAIGGLVPIQKSQKMRWLNMVFSKYPDKKFHGFGLTSIDLVNKYPWFSVDSSSWLNAGKTGDLYDIFLGVKHYTDLNDVWRTNIIKKGLEVEKIKKEYMERLRFNIISYLELQNQHVTVPFKIRQNQLQLYGLETIPERPVVDYKDYINKNYPGIKNASAISILQHEFGLSIEEIKNEILNN